ncbi:hypothetical protein SSP24_12840 [Streptomyces spinoverrucosus]|uniref:Uncharacterized protein n=1 Tax=Streptomyces spinoverrucosus TaxID=284043 RepID=A0A4Y3VD63_9ACTN|nr:hypothetical protein SSP24_12840 [Streptomyces spinoverrucosus]GHB51208.1 hypothetical protein GCM10010397_21830 [Streptomyces spinoverrucosus]
MTSSAQQTRRGPAGRGLMLLAVLAGLLAMHGLAPGAATAGHADSPIRHAAASHADSHAPPAPTIHEPGQACAHAVEDGLPGHVDHADASCSASGIGTSYAPPVLIPAVATASAVLLAAPGRATAATETGRAPPDLAELQLLRI